VDAPAANHPARAERPPIAYFDPGWLFLATGILILGATLLIPAADELADVQVQRDRALTLERHRVARLERYQEYLSALEREEPALYQALAQSQLNQIPEGRQLVLERPAPLVGTAASSASVFAGLEPPPAKLPERRQVGSLLERWTTSDRLRPWLLAGGAVCLLIGLLPRSLPEPEPGAA
jgi:hypothetical protein